MAHASTLHCLIPELPLDMDVTEGSDNGDSAVKWEASFRDIEKCEVLSSGLPPEADSDALQSEMWPSDIDSSAVKCELLPSDSGTTMKYEALPPGSVFGVDIGTAKSEMFPSGSESGVASSNPHCPTETQTGKLLRRNLHVISLFSTSLCPPVSFKTSVN